MRKIAIFSDIHGNLPALEAVLAAVAGEGVERLVCLGDLATLGPQPHEVIARVRALGCPVVMGNTDATLLSPPRRRRAERLLAKPGLRSLVCRAAHGR